MILIMITIITILIILTIITILRQVIHLNPKYSAPNLIFKTATVLVFKMKAYKIRFFYFIFSFSLTEFSKTDKIIF